MKNLVATTQDKLREESRSEIASGLCPSQRHCTEALRIGQYADGYTVKEVVILGGGRGIRTPGGVTPTTVFPTRSPRRLEEAIGFAEAKETVSNYIGLLNGYGGEAGI